MYSYNSHGGCIYIGIDGQCTTGATSAARTAYLSEAHEFTPGF